MHDIERLFSKHRLAVGVACVGLGATALLAGYFGVSGTRVVSDQLAYLMSGGLGGVALVILGTGLMVVDYFSRLEQAMHGETTGSRAGSRDVGTGGATEILGPDAAQYPGDVFVVPGALKYHAANCAVVAKRSDVATMAVGDAELDGLTSCGLCMDRQQHPEYASHA